MRQGVNIGSNAEVKSGCRATVLERVVCYLVDTHIECVLGCVGYVLPNGSSCQVKILVAPELCHVAIHGVHALQIEFLDKFILEKVARYTIASVFEYLAHKPIEPQCWSKAVTVHFVGIVAESVEQFEAVLYVVSCVYYNFVVFW